MQFSLTWMNAGSTTYSATTSLAGLHLAPVASRGLTSASTISSEEVSRVYSASSSAEPEELGEAVVRIS